MTATAKHLRIGSTSIDMLAYAIAGNAILGIRDSGKSYSATLFAEELHEIGIPFVAFDPIGVWRFLRVPGPGRNGKGYPVVVAGGEDGDLPLTVTGAPEILRAAMASGVSLVIDLFDRRLSKADWRRIVTSCAEVLLHENRDHGLRHVFLEEAPEFVPQRFPPDGAKAYDAIERLARMGGNSGVGLTLIGQRSAEINKAVLELCDSLYLHRQKGRNSLDHLEKWLKVGSVTDSKAVMETLATLPTGECWAWLAHSDQPVRLKMPAKRSLHPDRRSRHGSIRSARKTVDVGGFVAKMRGSLAELEKEAEANDPVVLRRQIAALKAQLAKKPGAREVTDAASLQKAEQAAHRLGHAEGRESARAEFLPRAFREGWRRGWRTAMDAALTSVKASSVITTQAEDEAAAIFLDNVKIKPAKPSLGPIPVYNARPAEPNTLTPIDEVKFPGGVRFGQARTNAGKAINYQITPMAAMLPQGEHKVLLAAAQHGEADGVSREQLTVLVGYKKSSRDTYIHRLQSKGLVENRDGRIHPTAQGVAALGDSYERLPTGTELQQWWLNRLPTGERKILELVLQIGTRSQPVSRDELGHLTGYKRSARDTYIQRLGAKRLVETGPFGVKASAFLFD